jgi:hypothetical protein
MSPLEIRLARQFALRSAKLAPDLASAILATIKELQAAIQAGEMARAIQLGTYLQKIDDILAEPSYSGIRSEVRRAIQEAIRFQAPDVPKGPTKAVSVGFDILNPVHIEAARSLETRVIQQFKDDTRGAIKQAVERGLAEGKGPYAISKSLRDVVGLAPSQEMAVANFRQALEEGKVGRAMRYTLRDKRLKISKEMTPAQIDKAVNAYRKRFIAHHADTVSRSATLDALKKGQQLAWEQAIENGAVSRERLQKTWVTVGDTRVRESHQAMNGETVPFDSAYSNGQYIPGQPDEWNCRCLSRVTQRRAA